MKEVDRFRADLARLLPEGLTGPLALAVSGGPDSMALLWLAHRALSGRVIAATVDHGLRPESAAEAAAVARWCADAGVPHRVLPIEVPKGASGNLQAWARQERYRLLKRWAIGNAATLLATAHHADDQAETFLMRAARGSGLAGLGAIRARLNQPVPLAPGDPGGNETTFTRAPLATIRPLLTWRRAALRVLCEAQAIPFIDDPSNEDERFDRTRFRAWLAQAPWLDPVAIARSADHLAEADAELSAISHWLTGERLVGEPSDDIRFQVADLPRGVRRFMTRTGIDWVRSANGIVQPAWSRGSTIEPLLDALEQGRAATQAGVLVTPKGTVWRFVEAPPRRTG